MGGGAGESFGPPLYSLMPPTWVSLDRNRRSRKRNKNVQFFIYYVSDSNFVFVVETRVLRTLVIIHC